MAISSPLFARSQRALGIIVTLAVMLTYLGFRDIHMRFHGDRFALHTQIIAGDAESPYRYRVLVPYTAEAVRQLAGLVVPGGEAPPFVAAYLLVDFVSFLLTLAFLCVLMREWFSEEQALIGVLLAAMSVTITLRDHAFQPWSYLEPALFAMGLLAVKRGAYRWLALLTIVATLNRETGLLLPLACFAISLGRDGLRAAGRYTAPSLAAWVLVSFGLRAILGNARHAHSLSDILALNLRPLQLALTLMAWVSLFGVLWIWSAKGLRRAPDVIRYAAAVIPIQIGLIAVWGIWVEVRLMLVLLPIMIPLALSFMFPPRATPEQRP